MPIIKYNVNEVYISSSNFLANASLKIEKNYLQKKLENGEQISLKKKKQKEKRKERGSTFTKMGRAQLWKWKKTH